MRVQVAEQSTVGKRQNNEDTVVSARMSVNGSELALLGVFDGVGGKADGETASRIAAEMLLSYTPTIAGLLSDSSLSASGQISAESVQSAAGMWRSDAAVCLHSAVQKDNKNPDMATTCVAAAMSGDTLIGWWLGDSRAYRFRDGKLFQLTLDHSTVVELGLPEEEALDHPERNQITKYLRASSTYEPEILVEEWHDGDVVLLVSDGVSGSLTSWELETFLAYWLISDISAEMLATRLLEHIAPNQSDNASVAVAIRGTPRPLGEAFPQVSLAALLGYGLTEDVLTALVSYPANSAEWDTRHVPPWRTLPASTQLLNSQPRPSGGATGSTFVEVISPRGERTTLGPSASITLASSDGALREVSHTTTSESIAFRAEYDDERLRISTPLGSQLETHAIEVLDPAQGSPLAFTLDDHLIVVASGELNSLDIPIRIRSRTLDLDVEDTIAPASGDEDERTTVRPIAPEPASDAPAAPDTIG